MRTSARTWALTAKGADARDAWSPTTSPLAQCVPMSAPMLMTYPVALELTRAGEHVTVRSDWMGAERMIFMDGELSYRPDLTVGGMECDREAASRFFREFQ